MKAPHRFIVVGENGNTYGEHKTREKACKDAMKLATADQETYGIYMLVGYAGVEIKPSAVLTLF